MDAKVSLDYTVICHIHGDVQSLNFAKHTHHVSFDLTNPWQYLDRIIHLIYPDVHDK